MRQKTPKSSSPSIRVEPLRVYQDLVDVLLDPADEAAWLHPNTGEVAARDEVAFLACSAQRDEEAADLLVVIASGSRGKCVSLQPTM
jgi:hypothetical protein